MPDFPLKLIFNRLVIPCFIKGPLRSTPLEMLVDTGIALSIITRDKAVKLGFEPETSERSITLETAGGLIMGPIITIPKLFFLGYVLSDIDMLCSDISVLELGAEARLGMESIKRFDVEFHFSTETMRIKKIRP